MRWVKRYKNQGTVKNRYRKPIAYKVKKEILKLYIANIKVINHYSITTYST